MSKKVTLAVFLGEILLNLIPNTLKIDDKILLKKLAKTAYFSPNRGVIDGFIVPYVGAEFLEVNDHAHILRK